MSDNDLVKTKKIDTRLNDYLFALVDAYAKRHGLKRTQVIVRALEKYFGIQHADPVEFASRNILPTTAFHTPETTMMQETHEPPGGSTLDPSAASAGGSETAQEPVHYQKGTGRKS
jgi:hypothetical protein